MMAIPAGAQTAAGIPQGQVTVLVPKDQLLVVRTSSVLNSYSAKLGEKIRYVVVQDFIVNGYLIAKAGDAAESQVQEGQAGETGIYGFGQKAANLRVSVDQVYTYCGDTLLVDFDRSEYRRTQGFLGSHKDVEIAKGQKYVPFVDHPQKVCAMPTTQTSLPIPQDALRSADH
ncbi:MAG: hypothetical protein ACXWNZ_18185 [Vulcanimicrobiaceae bacterium]